MNKKKYQEPAIKVYAVEVTSFICGSEKATVTSISSSSSSPDYSSDYNITLGGDEDEDVDAR